LPPLIGRGRPGIASKALALDEAFAANAPKGVAEDAPASDAKRIPQPKSVNLIFSFDIFLAEIFHFWAGHRQKGDSVAARPLISIKDERWLTLSVLLSCASGRREEPHGSAL
jgi:hypothetical protein